MFRNEAANDYRGEFSMNECPPVACLHASCHSLCNSILSGAGSVEQNFRRCRVRCNARKSPAYIWKRRPASFRRSLTTIMTRAMITHTFRDVEPSLLMLIQITNEILLENRNPIRLHALSKKKEEIQRDCSSLLM